MRNCRVLLLPCILLMLSSSPEKRTVHIVTTGDVHGAYFDESYVDGTPRTSLMSVKSFVDSLRSSAGAENVVLLDAGDFLQGDNAAYYYNYVDTLSPHVFPRMAGYMGYDAVTMGNHDIETGHRVYDRLVPQFAAEGIPVLAGNAVTPDGGTYFPEYAVLIKNGVRILVMGFDNANISAWLSEELWRGMDFVPLVPLVQKRVDALSRAVKPDAVVVVMHSGIGEGDGKQLESQGLDVLESLSCVDLLICAHDHNTYSGRKGGCCILDAGSRAGYVGYATVTVTGRGSPGRNEVNAMVRRLDKKAVDTQMKERFRPEFEKVREFTLRPVGNLSMPLETRDAYVGMSDYVNFIHTVQLSAPEAQISFAAPLTFNGRVSAGQVVYNDLFTIYPFENQLFVMKMKGHEIVSYLEESYDRWIETPGEHVLRITREDAKTDGRWRFVDRTYNFDSAAGLRYTVDVSRPRGERIKVECLADGSVFNPEEWYNVAMTSYRANGGGSLLEKGCGIGSIEAGIRVVARYPEIREMIYAYLKEHSLIDSALVGDEGIVGAWRFVPDGIVPDLLLRDMELVFNF